MVTLESLIKNTKDEPKLNIIGWIHDENIISATVIGASGNSYTVNVQLKPEVKVSCTCPDFQFRWAYVLYKHNALLNPENFVLEPPKHKNPGMQLGTCKHTAKVIRKIISSE